MAENDDDDADQNWIERNSKTITTLATVSIPIVIAIFGYFANRSLQQDQLDQSYVVLAIETLKTELPVNERKECVSKVSELRNEAGEDFDTAADLADAFQDEVSRPTAAESGTTGTNLPQTLFRSYALDLLLTSTPATLTVPQYKALLCAETIVPALSDQPAEAAADAEQADATDELYNRLVDTAVDADEACGVRITEGEVDAVGSGLLSASDTVYVVKRVAIERIPAPTESESGPTLAPTNVLYLEVEVTADSEGETDSTESDSTEADSTQADSTEADTPTLMWIRSQSNVEIRPDRDTCTPP